MASAVSGYEDRQKRNDWNDEQCLTKVNERNKSCVKMLNRKTRVNIQNYKNKWRKAKEMWRGKRAYELKVLERIEGKKTGKKVLNNRLWNKARFQLRESICNERDNNLIGNNQLIAERKKQHFYDTEIREQVTIKDTKYKFNPQQNMKYGK